jgi:hypothetical protein
MIVAPVVERSWKRARAREREGARVEIRGRTDSKEEEQKGERKLVKEKK